MAHTFNAIRSIRILTIHTMHELLVRPRDGFTIPWPDHLPAREVMALTCERTILRLLHEICASVPGFFGYPNPEVKIRALSGQALIWPLFIVAIAEMTPSAMRSWVCAQMEKIDGLMQIRQALAMKKRVHDEKGILWEKGTTILWEGKQEKEVLVKSEHSS